MADVELRKSMASPGSRVQAPISLKYNPVSFCCSRIRIRHYELINPSDTKRHPRQPGWQIITATGPIGQNNTRSRRTGQCYFTLLGRRVREAVSSLRPGGLVDES